MHYAWHSLASSQSLIYTISVRRPTCTQPESCSVSSKRLQTTRLVLLPTFCHQPPWKDSHKDVSVLEELKENRLAIHKPPNPPPHLWKGGGGGWSKCSKLIFACNSAMILQTASKDVLSAPYKHVLMVAILTIDKSITTDGIATENTVVIIVTTVPIYSPRYSVPIWRSTDVN